MEKTKLLKIICGTLIVVVFAFLFAKNYTFSSINKFAWTPNWFNVSSNYVPCPEHIIVDGCFANKVYNDIGFPIKVPGAAISGPYWLANTINYAVLGLLSLGLTLLMIKRFKFGTILGLVLIVLILIIPTN